MIIVFNCIGLVERLSVLKFVKCFLKFLEYSWCLRNDNFSSYKLIWGNSGFFFVVDLRFVFINVICVRDDRW